ncbi:hypothetical protein [Phocoenobacter skyensis]|uniref:Uncharacterized protein n=1 Tax=Phocoenobacter skyensis TaxID=97481 RepID=A0A1H7V9V7_9PAST|nr:hypothetical protein [Pasteurella skyensis]SEM05718.1 hypothetical protein SAMN05444853_10421 [Pasteurella skyensis]
MDILLDRTNQILFGIILSAFFLLSITTNIDDETANAINTCQLQQGTWHETGKGGYCD